MKSTKNFFLAIAITVASASLLFYAFTAYSIYFVRVRTGPVHIFHLHDQIEHLTESIALEKAKETLLLDKYNIEDWTYVPRKEKVVGSSATGLGVPHEAIESQAMQFVSRSGEVLTVTVELRKDRVTASVYRHP